MPQALTFGDPRSGYAEIIRNARGVDIIGFNAFPNAGNASGVDDFSEGEFAILDGVTPKPYAHKSVAVEKAAWMVIVGKERSDIRGSRTTSLVLGNGYHARTSGFSLSGGLTTADYSYGVLLTVENGKLRPATSGESVLAFCLTGVYTVQTDAEKALNRTPFQIITVEVGPRGKV